MHALFIYYCIQGVTVSENVPIFHRFDPSSASMGLSEVAEGFSGRLGVWYPCGYELVAWYGRLHTRLVLQRSLTSLRHSVRREGREKGRRNEVRPGSTPQNRLWDCESLGPAGTRGQVLGRWWDFGVLAQASEPENPNHVLPLTGLVCTSTTLLRDQVSTLARARGRIHLGSDSDVERSRCRVIDRPPERRS